MTLFVVVAVAAQLVIAMLLAVLHRHAGVSCFDQDVFVNAVGGVRISEPAADLAVLLSIHSSLRGKPLPPGIARKMAPQPLLNRLPRYDGHDWQVVGTDLVLLNVATQVVVDVLMGVLE